MKRGSEELLIPKAIKNEGAGEPGVSSTSAAAAAAAARPASLVVAPEEVLVCCKDAGESRPRTTVPQPEEGDPVDETYLQSLLDKEFGPPKFAVRKSMDDVPADRNMEALQALLDKEFGPPKFAVPKPPTPTRVSSVSSKRQSSDVAAPHLRLEVLHGPCKGLVFDTTDTAAHVRDAVWM